MSRPRAADDFPMIRSRMVELRRERDQLLADQKEHSPVGLRIIAPGVPRGSLKIDRLHPRSVRGRFVR